LKKAEAENVGEWRRGKGCLKVSSDKIIEERDETSTDWDIFTRSESTLENVWMEGEESRPSNKRTGINCFSLFLRGDCG